MTDDEKKARIRELNDDLRTNGKGRNGRIVLVGSLANEIGNDELMIEVIRAVRTFTDFDEDNDPHGEHDCATFQVDSRDYLFKIDYYALDEQQGSEHPEDPNVTIRIMSVMYAEDY